jgi:hypothetical protein
VREEAVHQAAVERELLVAVAVIRVADHRHAAVDAKRVRAVGIVMQQSSAQQVIRARRVIARSFEEARAVAVRLGVRTGTEVVIEGDVLLEDHHEVLDRCAGRQLALGVRCGREDRQRGDGHRECAVSDKAHAVLRQVVVRRVAWCAMWTRCIGAMTAAEKSRKRRLQRSEAWLAPN